MSADLLGIGTSGLRAARAALEIAGDNVANASTAGYARRSLVQVTGQAGAAMTPLSRSLSAGVGVDVTGLRRISDAFRNTDVRNASGEAGRSTALQDWLEPLHSALPFGDAAIGAGIGALFDAGSAVAADPGALAPRTVFLAAADSLASRFRLAALKVADQRAGVATAITAAAARISSLARTLATTNSDARRVASQTAEAATIADRRDALLDELHGLIAVRSTVGVDGSVDVRFASGTALVTGSEAATVVARDGPAGFQIITDPYGSSAATQSSDSGTLAGLFGAARRSLEAGQALDRLAASVSSTLNTAHEAGADLESNPGLSLFAGTSAATLSVPITDPRQVAAAAPPGPDGNQAMLTLISVRDAGFADIYDAEVTTLANAFATAREDGAAAVTARDAAVAARDAVSGVNLDEEAADILRFQQAYQAAARIVSTARTLFDTLFDIR